MLEQGLDSRRAVAAVPAFNSGDRFRARLRAPLGAMRLPRYVRGHVDVVERATAGTFCPTPTPVATNGLNRSTVSAFSPKICGAMQRFPVTWSLLACGRAILSENETLRPASAKFAEPWQAEVLALSVTLQETGHFTPAEWSTTLGDEIERARAAADPADGTTYYSHALAALERLVADNELVPTKALDQRRKDWEDPYRRTPHGQPVVLAKDSANGLGVLICVARKRRQSASAIHNCLRP